MDPRTDTADEVTCEVDGHVAIVRLDRPERQNAITRTMLAGLAKVRVRVNRDPEVRAVVLTGSGRVFCAGLDLRGGSGIGEGRQAPTLPLRDAPLAVQGTKRMMRMGLDEPFETHVHHVYLQLLPLFGSDDFREGMATFMEKRAAEFRGR